MPSAEEIVEHEAPGPPAGASPWVGDARPSTDVRVVTADPAWPETYAEVALGIREALGGVVVALDHVGSTSVPGLVAKPITDVCLVVGDPGDEAAYVPALVAAGYVHRVREPWWQGHRLLRLAEPAVHLHVFGPDAAEPVRMRIFRDWLRDHPEDLRRYAAAKREAARATTAAGEHMMDYNARKQAVVREIYDRAFRAAGLLAD
ncbi:MAG: GrpB family protein [Nocardioidaceae bacterium]|nr:GrpB family protein [Nocardioidaceae bacterium]MCL2615026.1 GrpB family protein [Nocardioidaceae bacterium]